MIEIIARIIYGLILIGFFVFFPINIKNGKFENMTAFTCLGVFFIGLVMITLYVAGLVKFVV